ncbi:TIGR00289 family protein [Methanobacterium alcaliphilum]|uniref:diphthine--ammonia ligase n=1 Tax=Methanobacterium alcaliphilum TaxID=392018 RepID=UPI00200A1CD1|nr:TIGR00289 family protein [Methanobacterium alcaliphilum]MCK9150649.1 TIGR00289 family protein [Methanobacterium alcaliphilum]
MKVAVLYSGGKDSTMAVYRAIQEGNQVVYLFSMISENPHSYMYHVPNIHISELSSQALNIPLIKGSTQGEEEKELDDLKLALQQLKNLGVEAIYSGALFSVYQKSRIDKLCKDLGLESVAPLWHSDPEEYMRELLDLGFEFILTGVAAEGLDESWLGRKIDENALNELIELNQKHGINVAFEGGEAETLVLDCPIFQKKIKIIESETEWFYDNGVLSIKEAVLEDK